LVGQKLYEMGPVLKFSGMKCGDGETKKKTESANRDSSYCNKGNEKENENRASLESVRLSLKGRGG